MNQQLSDLIKQHLGFHGKTDDKWWLQASVKHYLTTGVISGSFAEAIMNIAKDYAALQKTEPDREIDEEVVKSFYNGNSGTKIE